METVIIEFVSDVTGLQPAEDKLAALGKIDQQAANTFKQTNQELKNRSTEINKVSQSNEKQKNSIATLSNAIKQEGNVLKISAQEFKKMGVTLEQLVAQQKGVTQETKKGTDETVKATTANKNLRTELRQMTEQLTRLKLEGKENTAQYQQLSAQASKYRDALGDVSREVNRAASDTRKLDTVIEFGQGIAASFAVAQGAAALFGSESEELQETLLKVTSAMALLNGLQTIGNLLQKESNIIRAVTNTQLKLMVVTTNLQTAAQSKSIIVSGAATVAMRLLNTVMKANPALLLVSAFGLLAGALAFFSGKAADSETAVERLNKGLDRLNENVNSAIQGIRNQAEITQAKLDQAGAENSIKTQARISALKLELKETEKGLEALTKQVELANKAISLLGGLQNLTKDAKEAYNGLLAAQKDYQNKVDEINQQITVSNINVETETADEQNRRREEQERRNEQAAQKAREREAKLKEQRLQGFEDFKAIIEQQLLAAEKGSEKELQLTKRLANVQLQISLENDKLTSNQRILLVQEYFKKRKELDDQFFKETEKRSTENAISVINTELANINLSFKERERLTIELLGRQRDLEQAEAGNNAIKLKEISAKYDKEINEQRLAFRKQALDQELAMEAAQGLARKKLNERILEDDDLPVDTRFDALNELAAEELRLIEKRKQHFRDALKSNEISQQEFNLNIINLQNEEMAVYEEIQKRKTEITKEEKKKREDEWKAEFEFIKDLALQSIDALRNFSSAVSAGRKQKIDEEIETLKNLREAGAITEKEYIKGQKRIDIEKRKLQHDDAVREKASALFSAVINTAAAIAKALPNVVLAAIAGALGAAQIAAIAARPVPKFFKGKKDQYEGLGEVGESGAELIEQEGRMWVAKKREIVWLGKEDKVYNPSETKKMMEKPLPSIHKKHLNGHDKKPFEIDYEKLGKVVGKNIPQTVLNITQEGMTELVKQGNSLTEYLEKRRRF